MKAKQLKDLGPPEDVEYIERERHAVAVHEACHAVVAYRTRQHMEIDIATIEKGSDYLGMVASIPPEDQFTRWRSEYEADILVSLASLAGERMFFDGDSSSGVSGDLESATAVASFMEGYWGMGHTVSSYSTARRLEVGSPGGGRGGPQKGESTEKVLRAALADRIEDQLAELLDRAEEILQENRTSACSPSRTPWRPTRPSPVKTSRPWSTAQRLSVDGPVYRDPEFIARLEDYHAAAAGAHRGHSKIDGSCRRAVGWRRRLPDPSRSRSRRARTRGTATASRRATARLRPATASRVRGRAVRGTATRRPPGTAPTAVWATAVRATARATARPGYPPPPPVQGWGRPEPGSDTPTQAYGSGQAPPAGSEPGSDTPTQAYGPTQPSGNGNGNGNGQAGRDSGQTAPAAWYPTEPLHQQPDTGPVHIVGEQPVDTPPTGEAQVDQRGAPRVPGVQPERPDRAPRRRRAERRRGPARPGLTNAVHEMDVSGV